MFSAPLVLVSYELMYSFRLCPSHLKLLLPSQSWPEFLSYYLSRRYLNLSTFSSWFPSISIFLGQSFSPNIIVFVFSKFMLRPYLFFLHHLVLEPFLLVF